MKGEGQTARCRRNEPIRAVKHFPHTNTNTNSDRLMEEGKKYERSSQEDGLMMQAHKTFNSRFNEPFFSAFCPASALLAPPPQIMQCVSSFVNFCDG